MKNQRGVALFISLVLLLVLTIIGVSAVQTTSMEERMARNTHDSVLAFEAAEVALRTGETFLRNNVNSTALFTPAGNNGLWKASDYGQTERWEQANIWTGANSVVVRREHDRGCCGTAALHHRVCCALCSDPRTSICWVRPQTTATIKSRFSGSPRAASVVPRMHGCCCKAPSA